MELTERERRLVEGFTWLANVHHEAHHAAMIKIGKRRFQDCDAKTCRYAAQIVAWAESDELRSQGTVDVKTRTQDIPKVLPPGKPAHWAGSTSRDVAGLRELQAEATRARAVPQRRCGSNQRRKTGDAMTKAETAVLGKLGTEPRTVQELVDATSLGETTVRTAIKKLTEAGKVIKNGKGFITTPSTTSEPADASSTKSTKRKPPGDANRRAEAQARDAHILAVLAQHKEGLTRDELAEKAGTAKLTYMSLWRLHKAKKVRKVVGGSRQPTWIAE